MNLAAHTYSGQVNQLKITYEFDYSRTIQTLFVAVTVDCFVLNAHD